MQLEHLKDKAVFEPHSLQAISLWATMTRMRHPQVKNYKDKKLGEIVPKLTPLEKAVYLSDRQEPEYLPSLLLRFW